MDGACFATRITQRKNWSLTPISLLPHASGRTPRHFGKVEHPQNSPPALLPVRAMRLAMPESHSGQLVAATVFGVAICGLLLVGCAVAASDCFACLIMVKSFGSSTN